MPDKLDLWLASQALYRQIVGHFADGAQPESLPERVVSGNGLALNRVDGIGHLPDPEGQGARLAFLDARYDAVKAEAARGWRTVWFNPQGAFAPEEMPTSSPSSRAARRAISMASSLPTVTTSSMIFVLRFAGMNPAPIP